MTVSKYINVCLLLYNLPFTFVYVWCMHYFQKMFLVMELCDQGELCHLLRVKKTLSENVSKIS